MYIFNSEDSAHTVNMNKNSWSCGTWLKWKICCHVVAASKFFENNNQFVRKHKKGAPKKTRGALVRND